MKKTISAVLALIMIMSVTVFAGAAEKKNLKFSEDGTFRILQLSDTQDDQYPADDMLNLVRLSIEESDPDLIVFTGDLVEDSRIGDIGIDGESLREGVVVKKNGEIDHDATLENLTAAADAVLKIFQESGVPFVIAQGNNDHKCGISNEEWLEIYGKYSNCLLEDMSSDEGGALDCNLEIKDSTGKTAFNIWIMDTMRGGAAQDQIEWYKSASAELKEKNGGEPVPSILFQHIQVKDIGNLFVECSPFDNGAKGTTSGFYRLNDEIAHGYNFFTYYPCEPSEQFKAWKEQGDVIGAFFGHQHVEGFSGIVDGIELGFTYGSEMAKPGPYGYRLITLHEDDVKNYDNELYTYEGSVKFNNAHFEKQIDSVSDEPSNPVLKAFNAIKNFVVSIVFFIINLFA